LAIVIVALAPAPGEPRLAAIPLAIEPAASALAFQGQCRALAQALTAEMAEHHAAGDALVQALLAPTRRPTVKRLLDCARALAGTAHERLCVEGQSAEILTRLAANEKRPACPPLRPQSIHER